MHGIEVQTWFDKTIEAITENGNCKIECNAIFHYDKVTRHLKPDLLLVIKRTCMIIDKAGSGEKIVDVKQEKKK